MSDPEASGDQEDPTIRPIEGLLASLASGHVDSAALSGAAEQNELLPPLLLPSTPNDVKWEALHGGEVSVVDCRDEQRPGDVIKIYRSPSVEAVYMLTPPVGPPMQISAMDIVQIYPRDRHGNPSTHPTYIFQGISDVPDGYTVTYDGDTVSELPEDSPDTDRQEDQGERPAMIADDLSNPEHILGERLDADNSLLHFISGLFHEGGIIKPDYQIDRQTTLVWYPLRGKSLNVITPSGLLIKGHPNDIVELVRTYPDASRSTLRRTTLARLIQGDDRYMTIQEAYSGR